MKYVVPFILFFMVIGCKKTNKDTMTYFGGKILHPKSKYIILFNYKEAIDTIYLKKNNTFLGKLENITEGLYYFKHGPEYQYIYLKPKDSLLLRLNTWDFDESLVYSGNSANKNNALIESFLLNEKEKKQLYDLSKLNINEFKNKIDTLLSERERKLTAYKLENPKNSGNFLMLLNIAYKYPIYSKIEEYLINNQRPYKKNLASSFHKYRKNINMNLDSIMFFYPYSQYVMTKIYSDTYLQGFKENTDEFTIALLKTIDKNILSENLKNEYLRHATIRHFYEKSSSNFNNRSFFTFFKLSTNIKDKKIVQKLLNDVKKIHKGKQLSNFKITDYKGITYNIKDLSRNKNSVIYFRNPKHYSDDWVKSRINLLTKNNPNIQFLIINLSDDKNYYVKNLDINKQYYLPNKSTANQFLTSKYPRTILVNKKGIIENGFGALSSQKIYKQIADLQKK